VDAAEEVGTTTLEPHIYSGLDIDLGFALPRQEEGVNGLVTQLDNLQTRIQDTITRLTANRRYVLSAMLRPMLNSVRRIRSNVVRIQTQLTNIQSAATAASTAPGSSPRPGQPGPVDQGAIESIRQRVNEIQRRIGEIISRIGSSLYLPGSGSSTGSSAGQSGQSGAAGR